MKNRLTQFFKWLLIQSWVVICIVGTIVQSFEVSKLYFTFQTVTMTVIYHRPIYKQPQISFCFPIILLVNWDEVSNNYPDIVAEMNYTNMSPSEMRDFADGIPHLTKRRNQQAKFTDGREAWLINNLTYFAKDLITDCSLLDNETNLVNKADCWTSFVDSSFFKEDLICYSFSNHLIYDQFVATRVLGSNGIIQNFKFNQSIKSPVQPLSYFISNGVDQMPYHGFGFAKELGLVTYRDYTLSSALYRNIHLPPPYDTNCLDYESTEFHSADHCFETCERNATIVRFDALMPGPTFDTKDERLMKMKLRAVSRVSDEEWDEIVDIMEICAGKCSKVDCQENIIIPVLDSDNSASESMRMAISIPPSPARVAQFVPVLDLTRFIVQLGSVIGFWTGFSFLHFYIIIETFFCKLFNAKSSPKSKSAVIVV